MPVPAVQCRIVVAQVEVGAGATHTHRELHTLLPRTHAWGGFSQGLHDPNPCSLPRCQWTNRRGWPGWHPRNYPLRHEPGPSSPGSAPRVPSGGKPSWPCDSTAISRARTSMTACAHQSQLPPRSKMRDTAGPDGGNVSKGGRGEVGLSSTHTREEKMAAPRNESWQLAHSNRKTLMGPNYDSCFFFAFSFRPLPANTCTRTRERWQW